MVPSPSLAGKRGCGAPVSYWLYTKNIKYTYKIIEELAEKYRKIFFRYVDQ